MAASWRPTAAANLRLAKRRRRTFSLAGSSWMRSKIEISVLRQGPNSSSGSVSNCANSASSASAKAQSTCSPRPSASPHEPGSAPRSACSVLGPGSATAAALKSPVRLGSKLVTACGSPSDKLISKSFVTARSASCSRETVASARKSCESTACTVSSGSDGNIVASRAAMPATPSRWKPQPSPAPPPPRAVDCDGPTARRASRKLKRPTAAMAPRARVPPPLRSSTARSLPTLGPTA
mmetsp:Transcript_98359/g.275406  ORF Transcript_98359/g.275406 Transcript_98359/m.275406 type:complete len:237 (-) Transcript_98359:8-718(-)